MTRQSALRTGRRLLRQVCLGLVAVGAVMASGCREHLRLDDYTATELGKPAVRHPIRYRAERETLLVEVPPGGHGLSGEQRADVADFARRYRSEARGPLTLSSPGGASGHLAASRSLRDVEGVLRAAGLPQEAVSVDRHGRRHDEFGPTIALSYRRPVAVAPECGQWPDDLGRDRERIHHQNFGCAAQRNLALTVANSRDLHHPQPATPRSAERRSVTWKDYVGVPKTSGTGDAAPPAGAGGGQQPMTPSPGLQ